MKRIAAVILALAMTASFAAGCGSKAPQTIADVKGTVTDAGDFTMLVPDGWLGIPASDVFDDYEGEYDPTQYAAYKNAKSEWDQFSKPGVSVKHYGPETVYYSSKEWYDNVEDLEDITLGGRTWTRYTCTSLDYPLCIMETGAENEDQYVVSIWLDNGDKNDKLTPDDIEVQAIVDSITLN